MNAVQIPSQIILPCLCVGLAIGYHLPAEYYLAPAILVGVFACWMFRRNKGFATDASILLLCVFLGAHRMSETMLSPEPTSHYVLLLEQETSELTDRLVSRFEEAGLERDELSLVSALVFGQRDGLSYEIKDKFRQVGASHVLALSGMHLGIIYGLLCIVCVRWVRFTPFRWLALPLLVCGMWTYTLMTGMPASLVRSAAMLTMVCVGMLMFRTLPMLHTLSFSGIVMLFVNPLMALDVGFQLSFLAVLFIALAYSPLHGMFRLWPLPFRWPTQMILLSMAAQIGTLPLAAYYFHTLPLLGPLVSLFLVPLTTVLIYAALFLLVLPLDPIADFTALCVRTEIWIMDMCAQLFPSSMWNDLHPSLLEVILIYIVLLVGFTRIYLLSQDARGTSNELKLEG